MVYERATRNLYAPIQILIIKILIIYSKQNYARLYFPKVKTSTVANWIK